jgi:DNA helicase HerA-like ATPase
MRLPIKIESGIVVLGHRGVGKTNLIAYLIRKLSPQYHFTIFDIIGNLKAFENQENVDYYQLNPRSEGDKIDELLINVMDNGNTMTIIDEADRYKYTNVLSDYINLGRNYNTGFIASSRRTADIDKDFLANADLAFIFQSTLPQDLSVIKEWFAADESLFRTLKPHEFILFYNGKPIYRGTVPKTLE